MKKILLGACALLMVITLTGCEKNAKLKNDEEVIVSFNKEEFNISVKELYDRLKEENGINYLIEMIDENILNSIYETDDIANRNIESQVESYETYYGDKLLETLQSYGYKSLEDFKEYLLLNYKRNLALKDYVKSEISDSEIEKYYNDKIFGDITASHILISFNTNSSMTDEEKRTKEEEVNTKINEILKKLEEGEDFHELAKEYSDDTANKENGGRLEAFTNGEMTSEFEKAAIALNVGEYSKKAVKTEYGYHLIYKEAQKDKPSLEDVKETIIDKLVTEKINSDSKLQYKALIELRKQYNIEFNDEDLETYYNNAVNNWLYSKED